MKRILTSIALVVTATSAQADKIGDMRAKEPEFTAETTMKLFDIERCVIENENISKPWVYRQPDLPDVTTLAWESKEFSNTTLLEMKGSETVILRFWGKDKIWDTVLDCIGQQKSNAK